MIVQLDGPSRGTNNDTILVLNLWMDVFAYIGQEINELRTVLEQLVCHVSLGIVGFVEPY